MSFIVDTPTNWNLYVARADGTDRHFLMKDARNNGWSADGKWVLPADGCRPIRPVVSCLSRPTAAGIGWWCPRLRRVRIATRDAT